jgi:hypothetical protein
MNAARDRDEDNPPPDDDNADRDWEAALDVITGFQAAQAAMEAEGARLRRDNWTLMAEKAEREAPQWLTIQRAADKAGCHNEWARAWAARLSVCPKTN